MPNIEIPDVGMIEFPDTMSMDEITTASKRLYDESKAQPVAQPQPIVENVPETLKVRTGGLPSDQLGIVKKVIGKNVETFAKSLGMTEEELKELAGRPPEPALASPKILEKPGGLPLEAQYPTMAGLAGVASAPFRAVGNIPSEIGGFVKAIPSVYGFGEELLTPVLKEERIGDIPTTVGMEKINKFAEAVPEALAGIAKKAVTLVERPEGGFLPETEIMAPISETAIEKPIGTALAIAPGATLKAAGEIAKAGLAGVGKVAQKAGAIGELKGLQKAEQLLPSLPTNMKPEKRLDIAKTAIEVDLKPDMAGVNASKKILNDLSVQRVNLKKSKGIENTEIDLNKAFEKADKELEISKAEIKATPAEAEAVNSLDEYADFLKLELAGKKSTGALGKGASPSLETITFNDLEDAQRKFNKSLGKFYEKQQKIDTPAIEEAQTKYLESVRDSVAGILREKGGKEYGDINDKFNKILTLKGHLWKSRNILADRAKSSTLELIEFATAATAGMQTGHTIPGIIAGLGLAAGTKAYKTMPTQFGVAKLKYNLSKATDAQWAESMEASKNLFGKLFSNAKNNLKKGAPLAKEEKQAVDILNKLPKEDPKIQAWEKEWLGEDVDDVLNIIKEKPLEESKKPLRLAKYLSGSNKARIAGIMELIRDTEKEDKK